MSLQPEGKVNAEARLLAGDVQLERGNFEDAGKPQHLSRCFTMILAITAWALQKAALAYEIGAAADADCLPG